MDDWLWTYRQCICGDADIAGTGRGFIEGRLKRFEAAVNRYVTGALTQGRFDALVSFSFNVGEGALKKSTLLKKMNAGDIDGAAREFDRNSVQNR